jgi:hypothetical protein
MDAFSGYVDEEDFVVVLPLPTQPVLITRTHFDTSSPGAFGRNGPHGESEEAEEADFFAW